MENTGRILHAPATPARRLLFGATADEDIDATLRFATEVDRAHLVMLAEGGLVARDRACRLLQEIDALRACDFAPLRGQAAPRGLYLLYETYLIDRLGAETGGVLQTGRSRNDLNATVLRLRLRGPYLRLLGEALRLQAVLLRRIPRYARVVLPVYTHYQAAVPVTYGHYLAGIALALQRDVAGLAQAAADLGRCPLGAAAVGGTSLPIDAARTAALLGFEHPVLHAIDAVASRDVVLRLLAATTILGVTLSRLAADLLLWTTAEFGFLALPDALVGSSSIMPQKRNPFLLEHVQGRSAAALGAFAAAVTAMHAKPFTNSIAVGTEAVAPLWQALDDSVTALILARLVVADAVPQEQAMLRRAVEGYTTATELANRLTLTGKTPFRAAHHAVGSVIRAALEQGAPLLEEAAARWLAPPHEAVSLEGLDPASVAQASQYGGGPAAPALEACRQNLRAEWSRQRRQQCAQAQRWRAAEAALDAAVRQLCAAPAAGPA